MPHDHHDHHEQDELADLLDLDAQVFASYWAGALDVVCRGAVVETALDLGAGTGTGAVRLAERLPDAQVIAVDGDPGMLARVEANAAEHGVAARVRTVQADLDEAWPQLGDIDLVWASMSLHHLADPDRVVRDIHTALRPRGVLALVEFAEAVRFLPDDVGVGRPGLEQRCLDVLAEHRAHALPELGSLWSQRLRSAGYRVIYEQVFDLRLDVPYPPGTEAYARRWLDRMRSAVLDDLEPGDRAALHALLDDDGLRRLVATGGLRVRGERTLTIARS